MDALREACERGDLTATGEAMYNIFEERVLSERPVAARVLSLLRSCAPVGAMMSGSGPSVFAVFHTEEKAEEAAELLRAHGFTPYLCMPTQGE
jgi:4-diphosphocytidyl-2-C-methyl-D-erythritol kinase